MKAIFRWEFRNPDHRSRTYAEAELTVLGTDHGAWHGLEIDLVRDELTMDVMKSLDLDPHERRGRRVRVGLVRDQEELRLLSQLATVAAAERAYGLIFGALKDNPKAVEEFGDEWLTETMAHFKAVA